LPTTTFSKYVPAADHVLDLRGFFDIATECARSFTESYPPMCKSWIVALAVVVAAGNPSEDASEAAAKFEGTWQLVSAVTDGKPTPADVVSQIHIVIKDGKHSVFYKDRVLAKQIPFVIDTARVPNEATDTLPDGKQIKGIYKLDGDTLKSCVAQPGKERPTEFASKPGSGHTLRVFKRTKS
jgi:uncharacterized protein (TIGR03067 family)